MRLIARKGTTDEHEAFVNFYDGVRKLNLFTDFWTNFCFCCDWYCGSKDPKTIGALEEYRYKMKNANTLDDRINARANYAEARESLSRKILSSDMTYTLIRWTFQIGVVVSYFTIFAMLLVYYQDAFFCDQFKDNLKPNITSTDKFAQKCNVLTKKECTISLNFAVYNIYQYSQIRIALFVLSCIPYLFLYTTTQAMANIFMEQMNPYHKQEQDGEPVIKSIGGKTYTIKKYKMKKYDCWYLPPSVLRNIYLFLYLTTFLAVGGTGLALDGSAIKSLENCHETEWSSLPSKSKPGDLPLVLIIFNSITTCIGLIYFISRASRSFYKRSYGTDTHYLSIEDELKNSVSVNDFRTLQSTGYA